MSGFFEKIIGSIRGSGSSSATPKNMDRIRQLAEESSVLDDGYGQYNKSNTYSALDVNSKRGGLVSSSYGDAFESSYTKYHVPPVLINGIGSEIDMIKSYVEQVQALQVYPEMYDEKGNLKTTVVEKNADPANQPTFNRALPIVENTVDDEIAKAIDEDGENREAYLKAVMEIKEKKIEAIAAEQQTKHQKFLQELEGEKAAMDIE